MDRRLTELIEEDGPLAITEPLMMEILAGARSDTREHELIDCMIAAVARRHRADLLSYDIDLARVALVIDLELNPASLRG